MKGKINIIISAILFGVMSLLIKYATYDLKINVISVVFFRSLISALLLSVMTIVKREPFWGINRARLVFRGISGSIAMILFFSAISKTYISNAVILLHTYPIFATIIAVVISRERLGRAALMLFLSFIGIVMIIRPNVGMLNIGDLMGLGSGVFAGIAIYLVRELRNTDSPCNIAKYLAIVTSLATAPYVLFNWTSLDTNQWIIVILIGIIATVAQYHLAAGYSICTNAEGGSLSYVFVLTATTGAYLFFNELPDFLDIAGTLLIIFSNVAMLFAGRQKLYD